MSLADRASKLQDKLAAHNKASDDATRDVLVQRQAHTQSLQVLTVHTHPVTPGTKACSPCFNQCGCLAAWITDPVTASVPQLLLLVHSSHSSHWVARCLSDLTGCRRYTIN